MFVLVQPYRRSRRIVIASVACIAAVVLLFAEWCIFSSSNKGKIEGTRWSLLPTKVSRQADGASEVNPYSASVLTPALWRRNGVFSSEDDLPEGAVVLEFGKDRHLVYDVKIPLGIVGSTRQSYAGTYSLGTGSNVTLTLTLLKADYGVKITIDGDKLTMTERNGNTLTFKKVK